MNTASDVASPDLWAFSLTFYARPRVADALIALQDGAARDVNLVLFAIWLGLSGRGRLDPRRTDRAERAVRPIRAEVIEPLRAMRRRLAAAADLRVLRDKVMALELDGEKAAQDRLMAIAGPICEDDPAARRADAVANLAVYLGPQAASGAEAAVIRGALEDFAVSAEGLRRRVRPSA
jgi:uncharacterized protein (TIGR02444 family)